jgi:hypothetical protein
MERDAGTWRESKMQRERERERERERMKKRAIAEHSPKYVQTQRSRRQVMPCAELVSSVLSLELSSLGDPDDMVEMKRRMRE